MSRLLSITVIVSLAAHLSVFAPVLLTFDPARPSATAYDEGSGSDSFKIEQGLAIEGVSYGDAAERVEVAEVAPLVAAPTPPPDVEPPVEPELSNVVTATESPVEVAKVAEEPPPPPPLEPVVPVEVATVEQAAQAELFAEKSSGAAQDGGRAKARDKYAGVLNKALGRVRVGAFKTFGTVTLEFELDRSGKLLSRQIVRSSGNASLDKQALDMIDRAVFPPLPDALGTRELFTVPLEFKRAG